MINIEKTGSFDAGGDGFADPGELITYTFTVTNAGNVSLTNVTVTDPLPGLSAISFVDGDTDGDNELDVDETWTYTATYAVDQDDIDAGSVYNLATADSDESDEDTDEHTETLPQNPLINIDKQTVIYTNDGQVDQIGDDLSGVVAGDKVSWQYTVTNTGNVTIEDVYIIDDNGTPDDPTDDFDTLGTDFDLLDGYVPPTIVYVSGDENYNGGLDVGEVWIFESAPESIVPEGIFVYNNTAVVTGTTGLDVEITDNDDSGYVVLNKGYVTNSSFCVIEDFNVLFTPNTMGDYTETSTQPGQFFYNVFEDVDNVVDNTITLHIADGFALQSPDAFFESAVHVYDTINVDPDCPGLGFIWDDELSKDSYDVYYIYYGDRTYVDGDGRGEVVDVLNDGDDSNDHLLGSFDVVITFDEDVLVEGDGESLEGNFAVNVHLDHETEGSTGYQADGSNAVAGPGPGYLANEYDYYASDSVLDGTDYVFYATTGNGGNEVAIDTSEDSVTNINDIKKLNAKGVGGFVWDDDGDGLYQDGEGIQTNPNGDDPDLYGYVALYSIKKPGGDGTLIETMETDEDGWYWSDYTHKGKQGWYRVELFDEDGEMVGEHEFQLGKGEHYEIYSFDVDAADFDEVA